MTLAKALPIIALLERLDLEARGWQVVDHWDADECAVGIARVDEPQRLVYVSTFERGPERYYYECEVPAGLNLGDYRAVDRGDDVNFETLLAALESHLAAP